MLPTKGYFQDIECPYYNSSCGRPYCHFRHKKKVSEALDDASNESEKEETVVPTYKPTPKSELANRSHIPISYVPDLAFRSSERKTRPKIEKPTYKPTPLSILSSVNKRLSVSDENGENIAAIKEIKQNIANVEYDPTTVSKQSTNDINFEDLSTEFDLIDEIINDKPSSSENKKTLKNISENKNKSELKEDNGDGINEKSDKKLLEKDQLTTKSINKTFQNQERSDKKSNSEKLKKSEKTKEVKSEHSKDSKTEFSTKTKNNERQEEKIKIDPKSSNNKEKDISKDLKDLNKHKNKDKKRDKDKSDSKSDKSHKSNRDKHRKEEHKGRVEKDKSHSSHQKHKSRERSRSRNRSNSLDSNSQKQSSKTHDKNSSKSKEKQKNKSQKEKHKSSSKSSKSESKNRSDSKHNNDGFKSKEKTHKKVQSANKESRAFLELDVNTDVDDDYNDDQDNVEINLSDVDLEEDEEETMLECYKIFNEYKPPENNEEKDEMDTSIVDQEVSDFGGGSSINKKRIAHSNIENSMTYSQLHPHAKPKTITTPGQLLANRYKISLMARANRLQESTSEPQHPVPPKRSAPTLLEAARAQKIRREQTVVKPSKPASSRSTSLIDEILQESAKPISKTITSQPPPQVKPVVKKIAPAQNVSLMARAKERLSKIKPVPEVKTIAQTQKGVARVAHVPEVSLSDIPDVMQADKSKLPVNVRTRFLTMLADECVKLYISKEEAYTRALTEEFACYEKCKVLVSYRNSAMLAVNRLRKEVQERKTKGLGFIAPGEGSSKDPSANFKGKKFYKAISKWLLSDEELELHGYPRENENQHGSVVIKNCRKTVPSNLNENERFCIRCKRVYQVDDDGWPLFEEECIYHPLKKRTIRGEQIYLCCGSNVEIGCATSDTHVSEGFSSSELEGFMTTMDPESDDDPRSQSVYALDCEMCYTTKGLELTRVTIVDTECKTVYESLVKPLNPIIDYNTRFSGITKEQMDRTSTSILQIQANILHLCNSKTILIGHSLESDMKALKIVHGSVVDTSILFPHKMGLPHKRALKALASEYLRKIIQNNVSGHDSAEDAVTCMELVKWKLKEEMKTR